MGAREVTIVAQQQCAGGVQRNDKAVRRGGVAVGVVVRGRNRQWGGAAMGLVGRTVPVEGHRGLRIIIVAVIDYVGI